MMNSYTQILSLILISLFFSANAVPTRDVVKDLDVKKWMGRWYEIASFPSSFVPKNGVDTRATYTLKDNGLVKVLNEVWVDGKREFAEAIARKANASSTEGKLKLQFSGVPVTGDYWVIHVDRDYQYGLVGVPSKKNLFVLCRKTKMEEKVYKILMEKAKFHGYDVSKLHKTPQSNPPPPEAEGPKAWFKSLFGY